MSIDSPQRRLDARVPRARELRRMMIDAERALWRFLRALPREVAHFRRQATIGFYFADFACHRTRLVIEVDGGQHSETARMRADARRTEFLVWRGYRVLRFWNNEVLSNPQGVMTLIQQAIAERAPNSPPPPTPPATRCARGGRGEAAPEQACRR